MIETIKKILPNIGHYVVLIVAFLKTLFDVLVSLFGVILESVFNLMVYYSLFLVFLYVFWHFIYRNEIKTFKGFIFENIWVKMAFTIFAVFVLVVILQRENFFLVSWLEFKSNL